MGKTNSIIEQTVHTTGSGLSNELGTLLATEVPPLIPAVTPTVSKTASTILQNSDAFSLQKQPDAIETSTTTTANYTVGQYIYDSNGGKLYECILNSTSGELLTNVTYFIAVTSNTATITNGIFHRTNGKNEQGYVIETATKTQSIDFSGVTWVGDDWVCETSGGFIHEQYKPSLEGLVTSDTGGITRKVLQSDGKWYNSTDGVLGSPSVALSPMEYPIRVDNGTPQYYDTNAEPLSSNVMEGTTFTGQVDMQENVKIVDFGTIGLDQRYVIDNPFGNENYEGCLVSCQVKTSGGWTGTGWFTYGTDSGKGTAGYSLAEGIVVQTGGVNLISGDAGRGGAGIAETLTSAPCRVIVTYNGKAKDA